MKKLFFIAAFASAALVGCTKNEVAPSALQQDEITFLSPVVGAQTKVYGAIDATYDTDESFDVWCVHNTGDITEWGGTAYFSDIKATYNSTLGGWALETKYYWPATGKLSFVALSPTLTNTTSYDKTNGFKVTEWSQGASESAIVDLMYSGETQNQEKSSYTSGSGDNDDNSGAYKYKGVDLDFKHALSYLVFTVKTTADYSATTKFRLNAITLSGVYTTGDFTQIVTSPNPNWTVDTSDPAKVGTYVAYTGGELAFTSSSAVAVPETDKKEMILLPQTLTADQQKIKVDYQISTDNGTTWIAQTQTVDLKGTVEKWEMGKKYTYNLSIGMQEIIFDPAVSAWDTATDAPVSF